MHKVFLYRAIAVLEDTFNIMLLMLFLYFGTLFAFYGFLIISVSKAFAVNGFACMHDASWDQMVYK